MMSRRDLLRLVLADVPAEGLAQMVTARPERIMIWAGLDPDPWQVQLLRSQAPASLLCCSRQSGKSQVAAALALRTALTMPGSLTLLLSPTLRQSGELFRDKFLRLYSSLNEPVPTRQETALQLTLDNGSRVVSLPGDEATIRGYSGVAMLVIDEAARVPDALYYAVRPMLAVSQGRLLVLSTPFGRQGWFWREWDEGDGWERTRITADECPRIAQDFLARERATLGDRWYRQEYECSFEDLVDSVFRDQDIERAQQSGRPELEPLYV